MDENQADPPIYPAGVVRDNFESNLEQRAADHLRTYRLRKEAQLCLRARFHCGLEWR
jgi:hypothetical protein